MVPKVEAGAEGALETQDEVSLRLRDGTTVQLTRAAVEAAAAASSSGDADRVSVVVGGRLVSAIELVGIATAHETVNIPSREAVRALHQLGFLAEGSDARPSRVNREERLTAADEEAPAEVEPQPNALTAELIGRLRRHRGEWVALRGGKLVAHGPTLGSVLDEAEVSATRPASVFYVPATRSAD